jgi:hypothetical protein
MFEGDHAATINTIEEDRRGKASRFSFDFANLLS